MRVLLVNHTSLMSGAEVSLLTLVQALRGQVQLLAALPEAGPLAEALQREGVQVFFVPHIKRLKRTRSPLKLASYTAHWLRGLQELARLVRQNDVHIIHCNSATALLYGGRAGKLTQRPVVWHARDLVDYGWLWRFLLRSCDHIIAISGAVAQHLMNHGCPPEKGRVIYNPVDASAFASAEGSAARKEWGVPEDAVLFGMVSQIVPWKRHETFIQACATLTHGHESRVTNHESRFVLVGDDLFGDHPDYKQRLQEMVHELGLTDLFVFAGYRTDITQVMASMDVLVHPAESEPFGRCVAEAMAAGKAVVVAEGCGAAELIEPEETGLLVDPPTPEKFAQAMERLAHDFALRERVGQKARQIVADLCNPRYCAEKVLRVWLELTADIR